MAASSIRTDGLIAALGHRKASRPLVTLAAVALFVTVVVTVRDGSPARATSGGSPYEVPVVTDIDPDPNIVETNIVARDSVVDIGGGVTAQRRDLQRHHPRTGAPP